MSGEIVLYDLPARDGKSWSYNPLKTRMLLNFKKIPFTTQWVEYPDIAAVAQSHSIPPSTGSTPYTIPQIRLPDGTYLMDSAAIARAVEASHPEPSTHLSDPMVDRAKKSLIPWFMALRDIIIPRIPTVLLNDASKAYFVETRTKVFGRPLADLEKEALTPEAQDAAWAKAGPALQETLALLRENDAGPFFLGDRASYADFYLVTVMQFVRRTDEKYFEKLLTFGKELGEVYRACEQWLV